MFKVGDKVVTDEGIIAAVIAVRRSPSGEQLFRLHITAGCVYHVRRQVDCSSCWPFSNSAYWKARRVCREYEVGTDMSMDPRFP